MFSPPTPHFASLDFLFFYLPYTKMSMFEVPGWSVGTEPLQESTTTPSKKRKRPANIEHRVLEVNFDKIMGKLKNTVGGDEKTEKKKEQKKKSPKRNKREKQKSKEGPKSGASDVTSLNISRPKPLKPRISMDEESSRPAKKTKTRHDSVSPTTIASTSTLPSTPSRPKLTTLQQGMKQSLDGARFRLVIHSFHTGSGSFSAE
jgi:ribosomal RNA-processing protein 8